MPDEIGAIEPQHKKNKLLIGIAVLVIVILAGGWYARSFAAPYFIEKARIAVNNKDAATATKNLNIALALDSQNPVAYAYRGHIALGLDSANPESDTPFPNADFAKAIDNYEKALSLGLASAKNRGVYKQTLEFAGYSYWGQKEYDKAVGKYLEQIKEFPNDSFWARNLVAEDYFARSNKPQEALEILVLAPNSSDASKRFLGNTYTLLTRLSLYFGNPADTKRYAALALENSADKNSLSAALAYLSLAIQFAKERDLPKALAEYRKAEAIDEGNTRCTLASIYVFGGDTTKAIQVGKEKLAAAGSPINYPNSICIEALARSYIAKKNPAEAKKYLEQYMDVTGTFKDKNIYVMRNQAEFETLLPSF